MPHAGRQGQSTGRDASGAVLGAAVVLGALYRRVGGKCQVAWVRRTSAHGSPPPQTCRLPCRPPPAARRPRRMNAPARPRPRMYACAQPLAYGSAQQHSTFLLHCNY